MTIGTGAEPSAGSQSLSRAILRKTGLLRPLKRLRSRLKSRHHQLRALCGAPLVPTGALTHCYRDSLRRLRQEARGHFFGDYLEFGVCHGASMAAMWDAMQAEGVGGMRLIGFDSFKGLPPETDMVDDRQWNAGDFRSSIHFARLYLWRRGVDRRRVTLVKGWFNETLTAETARRINLTHAGIILVDCDIYPAAAKALAFCAPLIRERAIILFDDWHAGGWHPDGDLAARGAGEKRAFDEFLAAHPEFAATPLPSYSPMAEVFLVERR